MKKIPLLLIAVILMLVSCNIGISPISEAEGNVNYYIYPYLKFTLSPDRTYYIASVVQGAKLKSVSVPGFLHTDYGTMPIKEFAGFEDKNDSKNLEEVILDVHIEKVSEDAFDKAENLKVVKTSGDKEGPKWAHLPELKKDGYHFLGWKAGDTYVFNGMAIDPENNEAVPVFESHYYTMYPGKEPTCTEGGYEPYGICKICGHSTYTELPSLGHDLMHIERTEATCTSEGVVEHYVCTRCGEKYTDSEATRPIDNVTIPKKPHSLYHVGAVEATCSQKGNSEHYRCHECGGYFLDSEGKEDVAEEQVSIPVSDHVPDDYGWYSNEKNHYHQCKWCHEAIDVEEHVSNGGTVKVHPTLHDKGTMEYRCTVCNHTWEEDIPEGDHVPVFKETVDPTCTERGYDIYVCGNEDCDAEIHTNYTDPLGHNARYVPIKYATCTDDGVKAHYECSRCGGIFWNEEAKDKVEASELVIPATGHDFDTSVLLSNDTHHWHPCKNTDLNTGIKCDAKGDEEKHSHTIEIVSEATLKNAANCTSKAQYWKSCECGHVSESEWFEYGDPLGHTLTHHEAKASTCTVQGNIEYWSCSVCKKNFSVKDGKNEITGSVLLPLADHSWDEGYQADSTHHWHLCTVCRTSSDKVTHTSIYDADETHHWHMCSVCGYRMSEREAHNFVIQGETKYCTECGKVVERTDSEPGFDVDPVYPAPTGEINKFFDAETGKWTFTLRATNSGSVPTDWSWYVDDAIQTGETRSTFEFVPPRQESYVVMCIFWNSSGYGSASTTIN